MNSSNKLREWRAEEIAKIFLLKSEHNFTVDKYPTLMFDLYVESKTNPNLKFAVEVKTKTGFSSKINHQLKKLMSLRTNGILKIPVLLFKVDEREEKSEFDFLVFPSNKENKLLIRNKFRFISLNNENFNIAISHIENWSANHLY